MSKINNDAVINYLFNPLDSGNDDISKMFLQVLKFKSVCKLPNETPKVDNKFVFIISLYL